ncbi:hypothetical protein EBO34_17725 [Alteribacter keqinensis]|uniref:Uncharacterized protein n=1 Tax=Alteribacter keqinensis TaxID=2483800 RepID=A0A3M7TQQ9_9BACI|nr:hypothetical protein EBO34_17725 [Alteribacter keqinensis]
MIVLRSCCIKLLKRMRDTPAGGASSGETPEAQSAEDRAARGKCNERKLTIQTEKGDEPWKASF